jgi:hypothetical protein
MVSKSPETLTPLRVVRGGAGRGAVIVSLHAEYVFDGLKLRSSHVLKESRISQKGAIRATK